MKNYIGLYYPFIHFKDDAWIKLTALYWDKMARIVPRGYRTSDSDTVKQLVNETDFIEDVPAGFKSSDLNLDNTFTDLLRQHGEDLLQHYGVDHRHEWPTDPQTLSEAPPGTDPKLAYIYVEKMGQDLSDAFIDKGLALADQHVDNDGHPNEVGRVGMHPKLASVYMTALAEEMAASRGYHPVTDETLDHLAIAGCTLERLAQALLGSVPISAAAPTGEEIEVNMATIALESVLPRQIADVPTEKIIAFRNQHAAQRAAFQEHLQKMLAEVGGLQKITDRDALRAQLEAVHEKQVKPQIEEYKKRLKAIGIDTVMGALSVRVALPGLVTSMATLAGLAPINPILAVGGALAFSVLPVIRDKRKEARDLQRSFPEAYLMNVEEGLGAPKLTEWVAQRARQFVLSV
jgi:hypothetical protein